jgi:hypothetical protein
MCAALSTCELLTAKRMTVENRIVHSFHLLGKSESACGSAEVQSAVQAGPSTSLALMTREMTMKPLSTREHHCLLQYRERRVYMPKKPMKSDERPTNTYCLCAKTVLPVERARTPAAHAIKVNAKHTPRALCACVSNKGKEEEIPRKQAPWSNSRES